MSVQNNNHRPDFEGLKKRIGFAQVLEHYGLKMKGSGEQLRGACPLPKHQGGNPTSFSVNLETAWFKCFACKQKGTSIIDFVIAMESCTVVQAGRLLEKWFAGISAPPKSAKGRQELVPTFSKKKDGDLIGSKSVCGGVNPLLPFALKNLDCGHPYLLSRVAPATVEAFGLGFFTGKGSIAGRVVIPIHNAKGELVAYAGRAVDRAMEEREGKYKFPKDFRKGLELFNLHRVAKALHRGEGLILVEGFFAVFRLYELGYKNVVALMGSSLSDEQLDLLKSVLGSRSRVVLLFDSDEAGVACTKDVLARLGMWCFVRAVGLPDGVRQPDQLKEKLKIF